jgi:cysteinyl-tRNA synthetase
VIFPGVDEAERRVDYFYATLERLRALADDQASPAPKLPGELTAIRKVIVTARDKVKAALDDDLNTPVALAAVGELAKVSNDLCDLALKRRKDAALVASTRSIATQAIAALESCTDVLGLLRTPSEEYAQRTRARRLRLRNLDANAVESKILERTDARKNKDFARADALRAELEAWGVEMADGTDGTTWKVGV